MQHKQASWRWPTDSDWGRTLAKAIALKLKLNLLSNFYSILDDSAPPTCPINEQDKNNNKQVHYNNKIKEEVFDGSIPSAFADSGATSNIGTTKDRAKKAFVATEHKSDKAFCMPNGEVAGASYMDKLHHNVLHPAKDMHIMPGIECGSLLSIPKKLTQTTLRCLTRTKSIFTMPINNNRCFLWHNPTRMVMQANKPMAHPPNQRNQEQKHRHSPLWLKPHRILTRQTTAKWGHPQRVQAKKCSPN